MTPRAWPRSRWVERCSCLSRVLALAGGAHVLCGYVVLCTCWQTAGQQLRSCHSTTCERFLRGLKLFRIVLCCCAPASGSQPCVGSRQPGGGLCGRLQWAGPGDRVHLLAGGQRWRGGAGEVAQALQASRHGVPCSATFCALQGVTAVNVQACSTCNLGLADKGGGAGAAGGTGHYGVIVARSVCMTSI